MVAKKHRLMEQDLSGKEKKRLSDLLSTIGDKMIKGEAIYNLLDMDEKQLGFMHSVAYALYKQRQYLQALNVFSFLGILDISSVVYKKSVAGCLQALEMYDRAVSIYIMAAQMDIKDPTITFFLGVCFNRMNEKMAAKQAFEMTMKRIGNNNKYNKLKEKTMVLLDAVSK